MFIVARGGDSARKWVVAVSYVDGEEVIGWIGFAWRVMIAFVLTMEKWW
jgi:hypothetical protein